VIENVSGIIIKVRNAGTPSSSLEKLIRPMLLNMATPTKIKAAAVAKAGTEPARGRDEKHGRKHNAVKAEVKPVRPPMLMPAMLSM
jgi:hypothetical protein